MWAGVLGVCFFSYLCRPCCCVSAWEMTLVMPAHPSLPPSLRKPDSSPHKTPTEPSTHPPASPPATTPRLPTLNAHHLFFFSFFSHRDVFRFISSVCALSLSLCFLFGFFINTSMMMTNRYLLDRSTVMSYKENMPRYHIYRMTRIKVIMEGVSLLWCLEAQQDRKYVSYVKMSKYNIRYLVKPMLLIYMTKKSSKSYY